MLQVRKRCYHDEFGYSSSLKQKHPRLTTPSNPSINPRKRKFDQPFRPLLNSQKRIDNSLGYKKRGRDEFFVQTESKKSTINSINRNFDNEATFEWNSKYNTNPYDPIKLMFI